MPHRYPLLGLFTGLLLSCATSTQAQTPAPLPYVAVDVNISTIAFTTLALRTDGSLWSWGDNSYGQLGYSTGAVTFSTVPAQVVHPATAAAGTKWAAFAVAARYVVASRTDGTLWAWGLNYGNYGDGTTLDIGSTTPVRVPEPATATPGSTWVQFSCGGSHTLALRSDGTLWGWGSNSVGQLGGPVTYTQATAARVPTPATAAPGTTWTQFSAGGAHSMAMRSDGTLWGWGSNSLSAVGVALNQGTPTPVPPTQVPAPPGAAPGTKWVSVAAGHSHTIALRSDNTLWSWGPDPYITASREMRQIPNPPGAAPGTQWTELAAGYNFSAALRSDGSLWGWGDNSIGQFGLGSTVSAALPTQEVTNTRWVHLSAAPEFILAIDQQGLVYGTGSNTFGQLGDGTTTRHLTFKPSLAPVLATAPPRTLAAPQPTPNPAHDYLTVPNLPATATLRLHDTQGRLVREARPVADKVDVRGLASGLYLLTVQEPGQAARATRVVLE